MGQLDGADRPAGRHAAERSQDAIEAAIAAAQTDWPRRAGRRKSPARPVRSHVAGPRQRLGRLHPITQTIEELKGIMGRLGFSVADGPEIEDEWHNFEALNIPLEHPARDPLDNFYLSVAGAGDRARCCCGVRPARCRFA